MILIEVRGGIVNTVWCSEPDGVEVFIRDLDDIYDADDQVFDPLVAIPGLKELRVPHFVIY
ncbi:hypothetical protein CKO18_07590 [Rhodoferax fermentans]|uniref:Uncharacterized protein n=2 Tax=Rhodoferax fermentans TaxID=28066 RepID=A0A1T1AP55_RHOFE|nr:hypothetical protein [Rhodoferax fermentans]OOV05817.1 hypothetical protein RF819_03005 [Rhodoferax fermentans]